MSASKPFLEHAAQQAGTGGEQHPNGLTVISNVYLPRCRIQMPGGEATVLADSPETDPVTAATQPSSSRLHALNVAASSSLLASSPAEKFLGLYQYRRNANTAELSSWSSTNRGTRRGGERQPSLAQLLNMVLLLWGHREPHVLLLGEGGGKGNISCHLRRIWQALPTHHSRRRDGACIPVEKDQLWLTGPIAAKLMGWC